MDISRRNLSEAFISLPICDCGSRKDHSATLPCRIGDETEIPDLPQGTSYSIAKEGSTEQEEMSDMEEMDLEAGEQWDTKKTLRQDKGVIKSWYVSPWSSKTNSPFYLLLHHSLLSSTLSKMTIPAAVIISVFQSVGRRMRRQSVDPYPFKK